ncbi:MAG: STAS domain-containing protein [Cellvibrionales bacterium]|nr:STAS domain-containing protein [Cellvibrionales bacterium]MBK8676026.1 STAS domain-containing protein [Cellvibrionales bacterium]TXH48281.1 MAG: STAS domain-containing protein [Cellvibrionales bacterium]HRG49770.1 STAS domain-containing protein [Pseudomonadales bacterium]
MLEAVSANHYRIQGDIGMQSSSLLLRELLALPNANKGCDVYVDVSALTFADSLLLAALLNLQRQQQKQQQRLWVSGLQEGILGLARVYGIETLLEDMMEVA